MSRVHDTCILGCGLMLSDINCVPHWAAFMHAKSAIRELHLQTLSCQMPRHKRVRLSLLLADAFIFSTRWVQYFEVRLLPHASPVDTDVTLNVLWQGQKSAGGGFDVLYNGTVNRRAECRGGECNDIMLFRTSSVPYNTYFFQVRNVMLATASLHRLFMHIASVSGTWCLLSCASIWIASGINGRDRTASIRQVHNACSCVGVLADLS